MRLYIHMILCGSLCTLMYMLFDRILPYEFPLKWKRWLLRVNILFYLLPVPWLAAELRDVIKMLLETVVGITFPEVHDIKEIDTFNGTDLWKSMLVFNEEGKLIYITGYEKVMPVIKAVLVLCMTALFLWIVLYTKVSRQCKSSMVFLDKNHQYIQDQHTGKKVAVGISPCVSSPVTVGLIKPAILLPVDYHGYDDAPKEVILHELNHVSCKDAIERFFCFGVIVRMKKKIFILSLVCAFSFSANVCAAPGEMHIDHPQEGVTEGWVEEECIVVDGNVVSVNNLISSRESFVDYVGIGAEDAGPWEHGVTSSGLLYSYYTNKKYWHGSSVLGTAGLTRSAMVQANKKSIAQAQTFLPDNNHAYWRVDEEMK